jgi:hypothetical protein
MTHPLAAVLTVLAAAALVGCATPIATDPATTPEPTCVDGRRPGNLGAGIDPATGTAWVQAEGGPLCTPVAVVLTVYRVPDTWDGHGFNDTAVPQVALAHDRGTLAGTQRLTLAVPVPGCGNVQLDLYYPPPQNSVGVPGTAGFIAGRIAALGGRCRPNPAPTTRPTTPASPSPTTATQPPTVVPAAPPPPRLADTGGPSTTTWTAVGVLLLTVGAVLLARTRSPGGPS